jgi:hypothetical protein
VPKKEYPSIPLLKESLEISLHCMTGAITSKAGNPGHSLPPTFESFCSGARGYILFVIVSYGGKEPKIRFLPMVGVAKP